MRAVTYDRQLRRTYVFKQRVHHGACGGVLVLAGVLLMLHDVKDYRYWFAPGDLQARLLEEK